MKVVFHDDFYRVYASDPASAPGRMEAIVGVIGREADFVKAVPAADADIAAVHTGPHMDWVKRAGAYEIAALAAGGAIQAAVLATETPSFGLIRPPGHHASSGSAWGFCYFNNMCIALDHLRRTEHIKSAYVLDIDLHFGDGTVNILRERNYAVVHNIVSGSREAYLDEVAEEMADCSADIIGISAGFDNHEDDWGGMLRTEDYREIGRMARSAARRCGGGCFGLMEGGYNHNVLGSNVLSLIEGMEEG